MNLETVVRFIKKKIHQKYWSLRTGYEYIPHIATIELTSRCNANCVYCGRDDLPFIGDMSLDAYKRIIDAIPFSKVIAPWAVGESLIHPNIIEAVEYTKEKGKFVNISTNGSPLTQFMADKLLRAGLDEIRFSVDTDNADEFEKTRTPLKWDRLITNVVNFRKLRDAGGYNTEMMVRMTETKENRERKDEIIDFWKQMVDVVVYRNVREFFSEEHEPTSSKEDSISCRRIGDEIVIRADGQVVICCDDWYCDNVIGVIDFETVTQKDILEIFNGEKMNLIREAMRRGEDYPFLCDVCLPRVNDTRH